MSFLSRFFGFAGSDKNRLAIEALHEQVVLAARQEGFYMQYGIEDVFDSRFETFLLMVTLVLRRLYRLPAPAAEVAQDLVDTMIRHFDITLRQEGIGDVAVPKRIKKYAQAFAGRFSAYNGALDAADDTSMRASLTRNLGESVAADRLMRFILATESQFKACDLAVFTDGKVPFPNPVEVE